MKNIKYISVIFAFLFVALLTAKAICVEDVPKIKYRQYSVKWADDKANKVIDYIYIKNGTRLPSKLELGGKALSINEVKASHSPTNFYVDIKVNYDDKEETLRIMDWAQGNERYFTSPITLNVKEWHEPATDEQKAKSIKETYYAQRVYAQEIDCDPASGDWNCIKIVLALYREELQEIYANSK